LIYEVSLQHSHKDLLELVQYIQVKGPS